MKAQGAIKQPSVATRSLHGQAATEYLVTMGVVLVIGLLAVALLTWPIGTTKDVKNSQTGVQQKIRSMDLDYQSILQGLVAYYKLDEGSGTAIYNNRGSNNGSVVNGTWINGKSSYALQFDGVGGYASIPDVSTSFPSNTGTILVWANHYSDQGGAGRGIVSFSVSRPLLYFPAGGGSVQMYWAGATGFPLSTSYTNSYPLGFNNWNCVAFAWDGTAGTYSLYVNGTLKESGSGVSLPALNNGAEYLGNYGTTPSNTLNGAIDEVYIYNRVLSQDEVRFLCDNPGYPQ